jgi:hypothetical protein
VIRHVSLLTFAEGTSSEQVEVIAAALRRLPDQIPELRDYRIGPDAGIDGGNATFVVIGDFDDAAGYAAYRDHPAHVAVAREHIVPVLVGRTAAQYEI